MIYKNMIKVLNVAKTSFFKGIRERKNIVMLLIIGFILDNGVNPYIENTISMGTPVNMFEPFIMCCNNWYYMVPFMVGFMFVIVETPRLDQKQIFLIYRSGKNAWFLGEVISVIWQALIYLGILVAGTLLLVFRYSYVSNIWSDFTIYYDTKFKELLSYSDLKIPIQIYKYYQPYGAFLNSVVLMLLCMTLLGMILLLCSVINRKIVGVIVNVALLFFIILFSDHHAPIMWISPYCHMVLALHNDFVYKQQSVSLVWSYLFFVAGIIILYVTSIRYIKKHNCI